MKQYYLGIDGGGSKTHIKLVDAENVLLWEDIQNGQKANYDLEQCIRQTRDILLQAFAVLPPEGRLKVGIGWAGLAASDIHSAYIKGIKETLPDGIEISIAARPDATVACYAAHGFVDGGIVIAGTGTVGWGHIGNETLRWGGWSIEDGGAGSGYWLGKRAIISALKAHDQCITPSPFTQFILDKFAGDAVLLDQTCRSELANPRFFADFAKLTVEFAEHNDIIAASLLKSAAEEVSDLCRFGISKGLPMALMGGLAAHIYPLMSSGIQEKVFLPETAVVDGALTLAREIA